MAPFELLVRGQKLRGEWWGEPRARARIYLHGFGSDRNGVKAMAFRAAALAAGDRFVAADFRGHGQSEGRIDEMLFTDYVMDARAVLVRFSSPEQPAILVGSSLGGLSALWVTASAPELVAALVLIAPALGWIRRLASLPREGGRIVVKNEWIDHRVPVAVLEDCERWPEETLARTLRAPVLIFHGTLDAQVPHAESVALAAQLPASRCRLRTFAGGDHRLLDVLPVMVQEAESFLRAVASGGTPA